MGVEIERKFLVDADAWRTQVSHAQRMVQGYLIDAAQLRDARSSVRVRIAGEAAWLNVKSAQHGIARQEYEYAIPCIDAEHMLRDLCQGTIEKTRHYVPHEHVTFEIDEFHGDNAGLIVAELELDAEDQPFPRPPWLGREVSAAPRYYNIHLLHHPYAHWSAAEKAGVV
jgi:adenylate cyclase